MLEYWKIDKKKKLFPETNDQTTGEELSVTIQRKGNARKANDDPQISKGKLVN